MAEFNTESVETQKGASNSARRGGLPTRSLMHELILKGFPEQQVRELGTQG